MNSLQQDNVNDLGDNNTIQTYLQCGAKMTYSLVFRCNLIRDLITDFTQIYNKNMFAYI